VRFFLSILARASARRPLSVLLVLAVLTGVLGLLASQQRVDADLAAFAPDTELNRAYQRVQDEFGVGGGSVQVVLDAGPGGDVITPAAITEARDIIVALESDARISAMLAEPSSLGPPIYSYASGIFAALEMQGLAPEDLSEAQLDALAGQVYASPQGSELVLLLSRDRDLSASRARGGLILLQLDPDLDESDNAAAALAARDVLEAVAPQSAEAIAFNQESLISDLEGGLTDELPFLLGLSLLLIVGILLFIFRTIIDVVLGLVGLIITITWMYGLGVLMGPDYLGITGYFSQISIVVPVLLVGLGIDYAIHLTSRYREERAGAASPDRAAATAITSVGGALVLATVTTVVAFLTNVFTPVPPVRDFGLFTAAGVISAFIVMGLLVPSARSAIDRLRGIGGAVQDRARCRRHRPAGPARDDVAGGAADRARAAGDARRRCAGDRARHRCRGAGPDRVRAGRLHSRQHLRLARARHDAHALRRRPDRADLRTDRGCGRRPGDGQCRARG
jgi:uncharacterized protein